MKKHRNTVTSEVTRRVTNTENGNQTENGGAFKQSKQRKPKRLNALFLVTSRFGYLRWLPFGYSQTTDIKLIT